VVVGGFHFRAKFIEAARCLYNIHRWGAEYFNINDAGRAVDRTVIQNALSVADNVSWIMGGHSLKAGALFNPDGTATGSGSLYRLNVPGEKKFLHKNSLCGSDDTQWMVTYVSGRSLQLAFFSGPKPPVFTADAIANSTDMCGKFSYVK